MLIRSPSSVPIPSSEITPEDVYMNRRSFMRRAAGALAVGAAATMPGALLACDTRGEGETGSAGGDVASQGKDEITAWEDFTGYNNYYEFGTDKDEPARNARNFRTAPWTVRVDGLVAKPADYALDDFVKPHRLQEHVYRHRCVEGWSMVVPWLGFPIAELIRRVQPTSRARYVQFQTLADRRQMPGLRPGILEWPYTEGLRLDEAMHPLALFVVGAYGKMLLPQNGAPLRHVVPWKYGFKGAKSIVRITFTDRQPRTAWNAAQPGEYGFYANVNPEVDHPRWSQAKERRIGEFRRRETLMFNGYPQVASLYAGMDLRKFY